MLTVAAPAAVLLAASRGAPGGGALPLPRPSPLSAMRPALHDLPRRTPAAAAAAWWLPARQRACGRLAAVRRPQHQLASGFKQQAASPPPQQPSQPSQPQPQQQSRALAQAPSRSLLDRMREATASLGPGAFLAYLTLNVCW